MNELNKSNLIKWKFIDGIKKWIKNCPNLHNKNPKCYGEMMYSTKGGLVNSISNESLCLSCAQFGQNNPMFNKHHTMETKIKMCENQPKRFGENHPMFGKHQSIESNIKRSKSLSNRSGNKNPMFGKTHSDEYKKYLRLNFKNTGMFPQYNDVACEIMDTINKQLGWNLQHAKNGGEFHIKELGYRVDGYDEEQNIVVEYDESKHFKLGKLKDKDVNRQTEIINHLGCKFYRIRYNQHWKEVLSENLL